MFLKEEYVPADSTKIQSYFSPRYTGIKMDNLRLYTVSSILNELGGNRDFELSNVNLLIDTLNSNGFTFSHYLNVSELDTMFETAYNSGESGLGTRDRMILRTFAWPSIQLTASTELRRDLVSITYTNEGIPDFTSTIISDSGKTTKDVLTFCFKLMYYFQSSSGGQNPWTPDAIDYVNSVLPSRFTPKYDRTNNMSVMQALAARDDKTIWLLKALSIGPAYIAWIAENKWRLDLNWTP
jgi:hypothetical protein